MTNRDDDTRGMTLREIMLEMRSDMKRLFMVVDALDETTVKKTELDLWRENMKNTRRWSITTIVSLAVLAIMILAYVQNGG